MKKVSVVFCLLSLLIQFQIESCPTCQGHIKSDSPPFFTDDFYVPSEHEEIDEIYQALRAEQASMEQTNEEIS